MRLKHILLGTLLSAPLMMQAQMDTFKGARIDFLNAAGERLFSRFVQNNFNHSDDPAFQYTQTIFRFLPDGDGKFAVLDYDSEDGPKVAGFRFVALGSEDYPAEVQSVAPEVKDYGFTVLNSDGGSRVARAADNSIKFTPGNTIRLYLDMPDGYTPDVRFNYLYSQSMGFDEEEYNFNVWNSYMFYISTTGNCASWMNPSLRGPGNSLSYNEEPVADSEHPNRYWVEFEMPNEPIEMRIGATQLTTDVLAATADRCMSYGMTYLWTSRTGQPFWQGESGFAYFLGEMPSSDCYVNYIYDMAPYWSVFYNMDENTLWSNNYVWNPVAWTYCYSTIASANELIKDVDKELAAGRGDKSRLQFIKAQALTMRAHCYWRLLQIYAPRWEDSNGGAEPCVVLRTTNFDKRNKALAPMIDVLNQCYADLDAAIEGFKAVPGVKRAQNYETDLPVAYGVYARVAALRHDWVKCKEMARLARDGKRLATTEEAMSGYMAYNENEWMWAPSFDEDRWMGFSNWCTWFACNGYGANEGGVTSRINRELYEQLPKEDARSNWWFTYDKTDLSVNAFYNSKGVYPSTLSVKTPNLVNSVKEWLNAHKPLETGIDNAYNGGSLDGNSYYNNGSVICDGAQIKFWCEGGTGGHGMCQIPFMRAAEMWLYEAEACVELGDDAQARQLLMEINLPRNPQYVCDKSGEALRDEVRFYRRIELWGEGFSWFDLKRWNLPMVRKAWVEGDTSSGNIPAGVACNVPPTQNNGWRYGFPKIEYWYNNLIGEPIPQPEEAPAKTVVKDNPASMPAVFDRYVPGSFSLYPAR